jgi:hypothetical protein
VRERLRISEVPSFEGYRFYGEGKLKTIPDGWRVLTTIIREWVEHQQAMRKADYCGFRGTAQAASLLQPNENLGITLSGFSQAQTNQQLMQILLRMLATEANLRGLLQSTLRLAANSVGAASASLVVVNESGAVTEGCMLQEGEAQTLQPTQLN